MEWWHLCLYAVFGLVLGVLGVRYLGVPKSEDTIAFVLTWTMVWPIMLLLFGILYVVDAFDDPALNRKVFSLIRKGRD